MAEHIGIVACSAEGAALCYQTICREAAVVMGEHRHPEISMHTFPLSDYMERIYRDDWTGVAELMIKSGEKLQKCGAEFLISPDNTIHQAFEAVILQSRLPWLHIAEEVACAAKNQGYKRSGILGTKYLMGSSVYPAAFRKSGLEVMVPSGQDRLKIDRVIFEELVYGRINEPSKTMLHSVIMEFKEKGCDSVVLGCTEIPLIVLPGASPLPVLDSTRILARAALNRSLNNEHT